jgi:hypothetical protein
VNLKATEGPPETKRPRAGEQRDHPKTDFPTAYQISPLRTRPATNPPAQILRDLGAAILAQHPVTGDDDCRSVAEIMPGVLAGIASAVEGRPWRANH